MNWLKRLFHPTEPKRYELLKTHTSKIKGCRIGDYTLDLEVTGFLYRVSQGKYSWCETDMMLPTFKPYWDHEYETLRVLEAKGKEIEAKLRQDYYEKYGSTEYRF